MIENSKQLKTRTLNNMLWRFAERCGAQGVTFVVSIILARLLDPSVYGTIALLTIFINILNVFVDSGMGTSLIQKKKVDELDFSTVFVFNMVMCASLYLLLFSFSPLIANFYGNPSLIPLLRVLGLTLIISGLRNIQQAYISRHLMFRKFFFSTLGGTIVAACVGIFMAYNGFGAWALVAQQVVNAMIDTCILYITVKWRPRFRFSFDRFEGLFSYGWKLLVSSLIDTIYNEVRQLIVGKFYSSSDLAYYNQGMKLPYFIIININTTIDSVLLPVMSKVQDDKNRIKSMARRSIKTSTYVMAPLMIGLASIATPLISILLTEKWLGCVPYLRIFCITYIFYPIHTANLNAIKSMGRSDLFLKLEVIKKLVNTVTIVIAIFYGPLAMAYSLLVTSFINQIINSWPNKYLMNYSYLEQVKDILPNVLLAVLMGIGIMPISKLDISNLLIIILQIFFGILIYICGSIIFRMESFYYIYNLLNPILGKVIKK